MKRKIRLLVVLLIVVFGFTVVCKGDTAYGDGQGSGSQGGEVNRVTCSTAEHTRNVEQCGDDYGGASWHVFKLSNGVKIGSNIANTGNGIDKADRFPIYDMALDVITGKGKSDVEKLNEICPSNKYEWYLAYVYDGWNGANLSGGPHFYGPAQWGDSSDCPSGSDGKHCPVYHTNGGKHEADDVINSIKAGTDVNTWRIKGQRPYDGRSSGNYDTTFASDEAKKLYDKYLADSGQSPRDFKDLGFFCMPTEYKSFKGQARAIVGENKVSTGFVNTNKRETMDADCVNSGCKATFKVYLRRESGPGRTEFTTNTTALKSSPIQPNNDSDGTKVGETANVLVKPGEEECRHIKFKPYGDLGVDDVKTVRACVKAKVTNFQGNSIVSGATSGSNSTPGTRKYFFIDNCSPTEGCNVKFEHQMKRTNSIGSSNWTVSRWSNADSLSNDKKIANDNNVGSGTFDQSDGWKRVNGPNGDFKLYPGMVVCEKLTYKPNNDTVTVASDTYTEVCASALGDAQPGDMDGDNAFINIKVRNNDVSKYSDYQGEVYAKPGDKLNYLASYFPNLQYTYNLRPQKMKIGDGATYDNSGNKTLGVLFNAKKPSTLKDWNNAASVQREVGATDDFTSGANLIETLKKNPGITDKLTTNPAHSYSVADSDVGKSANERIITNTNNNDKTTPRQVEFRKDSSDNNVAKVLTDQVWKIAKARVPYNFRTGVSISNDDVVEEIDAGEMGTVYYDITLKPKRNAETTNDPDSNKYKTRADKVTRKLVVYVPTDGTAVSGGEMSGTRDTDICSEYFHLTGEDSCGYSKTEESTITPGNGMYGDYTESESLGFYAQDAVAGSKVCVAAVVYPVSSGLDTNWNDTEYDKKWNISNSKCFTVTKKPSLQAWGGNVYAKSGIVTNTSRKMHLKGKNTYSVEKGNTAGERYIFGSWGELGVISGGPVSGFASGAATGYGKNNGGVSGLVPMVTFYNPGDPVPGHYLGGGNNESFPDSVGGLSGSNTGFCYRSRLTIPNSKCASLESSTSGYSTLYENSNNSIAAQTNKDKDSIISKLIKRTDEEGTELSGEQTVSGSLDGSDYYQAKKMTVDELNMQGQAVTKVIHGENVRINGNIRYGNDDQTYDDLQKIPKVVIYAQKNINISCDVYRIDAILVAEEKVITCNSTSVDDLDDSSIEGEIGKARNSNQLIVNGAIIAGTLKANRTYGAASGANSIIPAEIINFDPVLYNWGSTGAASSDDGGFGSLEVNYIHELAPRR